jgi:hypothetical protein
MGKKGKERKKRRTFMRVMAGLGVGFLGLLTIVVALLHAPMKVIALLLIFLAACTILPKVWRKWFWLSVGIVVLMLTVWVLLPTDSQGWRPYTFDDEIAALEAKHAVPDEENAAFAYNDIFDTLDTDSDQAEFFTVSKPSSLEGPWLSNEHPETAEWLTRRQSTIEKLIHAAQGKKKCRFLPIGADSMALGRHMDTLTKFSRCTFLLVSSANNDMAEGRIDAALKKYLCVIQMANHVYQQPTLVHVMASLAIENRGLQMLNRFVIEDQPSARQLELVSNSLRGLENNWKSDWRRMLDYDKLYAKSYICGKAYEVNARGEIRFSRGGYAIEAETPQDTVAENHRPTRLGKVMAVLRWLYMPPEPQHVAEMIDASTERYYAIGEPNVIWDCQIDSYRVSRRLDYRGYIQNHMNSNEYNFLQIHKVYLCNLTLNRGSRLLIAIRQYKNENGTWPESLDAIGTYVPAEALIDPANNAQFDYKNHGESFSLCGELVDIWPYESKYRMSFTI